MWKYQQTNDMFIKHSDPELYHSDTYLGKDFSDGIKHWKYIKRERKNGRWVYYYNDDHYSDKFKDADEKLTTYYMKRTNMNRQYDHKTDPIFKKLARNREVARKKYNSVNGATIGNVKKNVSYSAVKGLNYSSDKINKIKKGKKKIDNWFNTHKNFSDFKTGKKINNWFNTHKNLSDFKTKKK